MPLGKDLNLLAVMKGKKQTIFKWNAIVFTAKISNEVKDLPIYSSGEKKVHK